MYRVCKRDGEIVSFDVKKISDAIKKAFEACDRIYDESVIDLMAIRVTSDFQENINDGVIDVESIQDSVERVLSQSGYSDVSKAYILYRKQRENVRNVVNSSLNYKNIINSYFTNKSPDGYSLGSLVLSNSGEISKNYWLSEIYDEEITNYYRDGYIYIHDLQMLSGLSADWDMKKIIEKGLVSVNGNTYCGPAKHLNTLCNQLASFFSVMQNEWSNSQSLSYFDVYLAPFVKIDSLSYKEVKQCIELFVYMINSPSLLAMQASFSNILCELFVPENMKDMKCIVGGKEVEFTYGQCQMEMDMINRALLETLINGDYVKNNFKYPIITYRINDKFNNYVNKSLIIELSKYNHVYYLNNLKHDSDNTMNSVNYRKWYRKNGNYYGEKEDSFSVGKVSINLRKLKKESNGEEIFYKKLNRVIGITIRSIRTKRNVLSQLFDQGLYPYSKEYLSNLKHSFGIINLFGLGEIENRNKLIDYIYKQVYDYQKKSKELYRLEVIDEDVMIDYFDGIEEIQSNNDEKNILDLNDVSFFDKLKTYSEVDQKLNGSEILKIKLSINDNDEEISQLLLKIFNNYDLNYVKFENIKKI